ncbi:MULTISPECIES: DUF1109 domain-containing protein [Bosea]|uniref:DUF1109 domain-containing protein n=1 Tax=Bosea TaxID=85413 RepID=UPI0021503793|nr:MULTISPECIES: DUF1109 domain-containing protein [Bosea]MCR4523951.1 DUF1109 domain-containing protein [Bosea sp. 47.2.35]MDR6830610.1 hypothetical protein [Bosea robiniae]MDR6897491.1 hypothetical protein [Bosea sp. BE109]MDR7140888.1 hypothetical protein [Bosea sp. BE168]MDR7177369.1 hypothetical protein [Bosea sp. BE271]
MQTDDLISLMTASHQPVDTGRLRRVTWLCALCALAATAGLVLLTLGPRQDLGHAWLTVPVLAKVLLGAGVAGIALPLFQLSLRPGRKPARRLPWLLVPLVLVVGWAALALIQAPTGQWSALIFGRYWQACVIAVPLYALCPLIVLLLLARRGAAVDGPLTGACAGLASAGLATVAYALHCPDDAAPFLATWYTLAIATVTAFGALVFPRFLRW